MELRGLSNKRSESGRKRKNDKNAAKQRKERRDPQYKAKWLMIDCRAIDKRRGRDNNLTLEFVKELITKGCAYCGDNHLLIGLDRINNEIGHLQTNVNPSCRRCNWLRRDMPYEAWIRLVPIIRQIAKDGLFGDWHAGPKRHPQMDMGCKH